MNYPRHAIVMHHDSSEVMELIELFEGKAARFRLGVIPQYDFDDHSLSPQEYLDTCIAASDDGLFLEHEIGTALRILMEDGVVTCPLSSEFEKNPAFIIIDWTYAFKHKRLADCLSSYFPILPEKNHGAQYTFIHVFPEELRRPMKEWHCFDASFLHVPPSTWQGTPLEPLICSQ